MNCLKCEKPLWVDGITDDIQLCHECYVKESEVVF